MQIWDGTGWTLVDTGPVLLVLETVLVTLGYWCWILHWVPWGTGVGYCTRYPGVLVLDTALGWIPSATGIAPF